MNKNQTKEYIVYLRTEIHRLQDFMPALQEGGFKSIVEFTKRKIKVLKKEMSKEIKKLEKSK